MKIDGNLIVFDEDNTKLKELSWNSAGHNLVTRHEGRMKSVGQVVMGLQGDLHIDHIDRNLLNNLRSNLRILTRRGNMMNKEPRPGVRYSCGRYNVSIGKDYIGRVTNKDKALEIYWIEFFNRWRLILSETRKLNFHLSDEQYFHYKQTLSTTSLVGQIVNIT